MDSRNHFCFRADCARLGMSRRNSFVFTLDCIASGLLSCGETILQNILSVLFPSVGHSADVFFRISTWSAYGEGVHATQMHTHALQNVCVCYVRACVPATRVFVRFSHANGHDNMMPARGPQTHQQHQFHDEIIVRQVHNQWSANLI